VTIGTAAELEIIRGPDRAPLQPLLDRTVAVIGYGNQGHAHALNLRDSGVRTVVAARSGSAAGDRAREAGFEVRTVREATAIGDLIVVALPDEVQPEVYASEIGPALEPGDVVGFLHGFAIRYGLIDPDPAVGVVMVAPKGPGTTLRDRYVQGLGIPSLLAVRDGSPPHAEPFALAWANGIGSAQAGIIRTTFAAETETDLFGEQSVLCGGMTGLVLAAFEVLVEAGYPPPLAYLECCHEVKQVADLVYERGLAGAMEAISNTAEFGTYATAGTLVDEQVREKMRDLLRQVRDGSFAEHVRRDYAEGSPWFTEQRRQLATHPIEAAGEVIRALMKPPTPPPAENA
jgi:ketol-acid reductoisomerase